MQKPRKSFPQIWNMNFGFLGIQFGWALQLANMSAIYEYLGASPDQIPILWLVVLVITIIGVIYYLAAGRRKQFAPVIAPAGDDEPLVTGAAQPEA